MPHDRQPPETGQQGPRENEPASLWAESFDPHAPTEYEQDQDLLCGCLLILLLLAVATAALLAVGLGIGFEKIGALQ